MSLKFSDAHLTWTYLFPEYGEGKVGYHLSGREPGTTSEDCTFFAYCGTK